MKKWDDAFITSMTRRYLFALSVLALIAVVADYVLQEKINAERGNGAVLNIAGRLRMLSQRIALYSLRLASNPAPSERRICRQELQDAVNLMQASFDDLINGDTELHLPGRPSAEVRAIYFAPPHLLQEQMQKFLAEARAFDQTLEADLNRENLHLQNILAAASSDILHHFDDLVKQYQLECETGIARLQKLERTVMLITVLVLFMMAVLIFRPLIKRLQVYFLERNRAEAEREKLVAELQEALLNVKTLRGLLPICASCKKIRDDVGAWTKLEDYLGKHSEADFTHGFCPECKQKFEDE
jgi:nitrate/nitrite-specific signal transduction histidine kinase